MNIEHVPLIVKGRVGVVSWVAMSTLKVHRRVAVRVAVVLGFATVIVGSPVQGQTAESTALRSETLVVRAEEAASSSLPSISLAAGERIAVLVESDIDVGDPEIGPGPVKDAAPGDVIARFGTSGSFAWPERPVVWIAPAPGALVFDVNAHAAHHARGEAHVEVLRLGPLGAPPPAGFEPPILQLDRAPGGARARWSDRAGYGVEPATLLLELTTSHGTVYRLDSWARGGANEVLLPLPPPGITLPPGIHTLTATIEDRLGGKSPPSTIRFDTP